MVLPTVPSSPLKHPVNMEKGWLSPLFFSDKVVVVGPHSVLNREGPSQPIHGQLSDTNPLQSNSCPPCRLGLPHSGPSVISHISLLPPICECTHLWLAGKATAQTETTHVNTGVWGESCCQGFDLWWRSRGAPLTYLHHSLTIVYEGTLLS